MKKFWLASGLLGLFAVVAQAESGIFSSHLKYEDVALFYDVFDASSGRPTPQDLQSGYLDKGSSAVRDFIPNRIMSASALSKKIGEKPALYENARRCFSVLPAAEKRIGAIYLAMHSILPEKELPETTILIGRGNSGGSSTPAGAVIGLEVICESAADDRPLDVRLTHLVAHELAHTQQRGFDGNTVLDAALNEGVAEFIGELVSGAPLNVALFAKANAQPGKYEQAFAADMSGEDISRWLYNGIGNDEWPGDLGYWVGYRIAKSYYEVAEDKGEAVRQMLQYTDAEAFLAASHWTPAAALPDIPINRQTDR